MANRSVPKVKIYPGVFPLNCACVCGSCIAIITTRIKVLFMSLKFNRQFSSFSRLHREAHKMAALVRERVGIKDITRKVTVPNNPKAKLMYYLDCVAVVIQLDDPILRRLRNYQNYNSLTEAETDALLALVLLFSPDELLGKVFFPSEDCGGLSNQFFELSAVSHMMAVSDNIVIGGERKRVAKVMFFKRSWLDNNFLSPIRSFQGRLQRMARGLPSPSGPRTPLIPHSSSPDYCCCNIL